ncbi:MAG: tyrosine-type recombinase/integrase [Rikenellaceae bacterium]|nr:tyrosine-type recombinase/integrase [Rikenellaceae bacterium]
MSAWLEPLEGGRCSKWKLRVSVGSRGSRRNYSKRFDGGKREANAALREFETEIANAPQLIEDTFFGYASRWNDGRYRSGAITKTTHDKYLWIFNAVLPLLPENIADITPQDLVDAYGTIKDRGCSGTTLRTYHNTLHRTFKAAVSDSRMVSNPCDAITPPQRDTRPKKALSPSQAQTLLDALEVDDARQFTASMMLRTGMRAVEVLGIEWRDVDDGISIRREVTKTAAGVRVVPLDEETYEFLSARKKCVENALASVGAHVMPTTRMCATSDGRPLTYNTMRLWWQRHRADYGLEGWTLHELRHTYLTNLAQAGVHPSVMQRLAGHSSINVTMKIYTHVQNDDLKEAVDALAKARKCTP